MAIARRFILVGAVSIAAGALASAAQADPRFGSSVDVTRASGKVSVSVPGGRAATLRGRRTVPLGTLVDARKGSVVLTTAGSSGGTFTADAAGGAFRVLQPKGAGATTTLRLAGPPPGACKDASASAAWDSSFKTGVPHRKRRRATAAAVGRFAVEGLLQKSVNETAASWETDDRCDTAKVASAEGIVAVTPRDFVTKQFEVAPGYIGIVACSRRGQLPVTGRYCESLLGTEADDGGVLLAAGLFAHTPDDRYEMCITGPAGTSCRTWALSAPEPGGERGAIVVCAATKPGRYRIRWRLRGTPLALRLPAYTARRSSAYGGGSCLGELGAAYRPGARSAPLRANASSANRYTLPSAGALVSLSLYVAPSYSEGVETLQGVVYADANGAPGALLGASRTIAVRKSDEPGYRDLDFDPALSLPAGDYWLGVSAQGTPNIAFFQYEPTAALAIGTNLVPGLPSNPFAPIGSSQQRMSLSGNYFQDAGP